MFLRGSMDRWSWEEDAFSPVAFCVEALVVDGLNVPPFDRHAEGNGRLRAVGLDALIWRDWLTSLLQQRALLATAWQELASGLDDDAGREAARAAAEVVRAPGAFCPGPPQLRDRLFQLWKSYVPVGEAWKRRMSDGARSRFAPGPQRRLWKDLRPFHDRLPTISVFLIAYPEPVMLALPPTSCLIAPADGAEAYGRQVVAAAMELASVA